MATATAPEELQQPLPAPQKSGGLQSALREAGQLGIFFKDAAVALPGSFAYFSEALRHAAMMVTGTVVLLFAMELFQGASIANVGYFLLRGIGAGDFFGLVAAFGVPRFTCALMFGYVFAAKICCGMTAQLGAMKIQQEVDAFESTGIDPRRYLVGTRIIAVLLFLPVAFVVAYFGDLMGCVGVSVTLSKGLSGSTFYSTFWSSQQVSDLLFMGACFVSVAMFCTVVACFYGLRTRGGPAEVGSAVARSLVVNLVGVHLIVATFAATWYGTASKLPIAS
jgi:phospholipid/cholesterol/gamma-HCH transport system permease protein